MGTTKVFSTVPSNADTSNEVMVFGRVTDVRSELKSQKANAATPVTV